MKINVLLKGSNVVVVKVIIILKFVVLISCGWCLLFMCIRGLIVLRSSDRV